MGGGSGAAQEGMDREAGGGTGVQLTARAIASKLGLGKGRKLLLAASACFQFVEGEKTHTRGEVFAEAKIAAGFYKGNLLANLSQYPKGLGDKVNEVEKDTYSINADTLKELKEKT